nr:unnamed protein product [Spirometra erinaceieuropaei]
MNWHLSWSNLMLLNHIHACRWMRHRHKIKQLFDEADCLHRGFVTKDALLRIMHRLCREMQVDQFHRLCERYGFDSSPVLSFSDFEATFGVPPLGQTKAPVIISGFGYKEKLSVAFVFQKLQEAARHPKFDLKELLPPSCFEKEGRILMPHLRELLARIRIDLNEENFRRLWSQKFDLMGVGSISTQQFLDQMNLNEQGHPDSKKVAIKDYAFPEKHRLHYKTFNGNPPVLKPSPCTPMELIPVSKPLGVVDKTEKLKKLPDAGGTSFPFHPEPTWKSAGPGGANVPPMGCGTRYKDRLEVLRQKRPKFRSVLRTLQYICEEPYNALMVVFEKTDPCHKGSVTEARLYDILRECGMNVEPKEVSRFAKMLARAVDDCDGVTEPPKGKEEQVRPGLINYHKLLRRYQRLTPGSPALSIIKTIREKRRESAGLKALTALSAEEIEENLVSLLHKDFIEFTDKINEKSKNGVIPEEDLRKLADQLTGDCMTQCQWYEFQSHLPYKEKGLVNVKEFLHHFGRPSGVVQKEYTQIFTPMLRGPLRNLDAYVGDPRDLNIVLRLLERLIDVKFYDIDSMFKHYDHAGPGLISKEDFGEIMAEQGLKLIPQELDAVWRLMDKIKFGHGQHNFRQVMRFLLLQTRALRMERTRARRAAKIRTIHDPNILKLKEFRACQRKFKAEHEAQLRALGKAALQHKYKRPEKSYPSASRVQELIGKIKETVLNNWVDIRNGFLWQDPTGWGSVLLKDFRQLGRTFNFPLNEVELEDLALGFDKKKNGYVQYTDFLHAFGEGERSKSAYKFDEAYHEFENKKDGSKISIRALMDKIRDICLKENNTLLAGFRAISQRHPEYISQCDMGRFLKKHGIELSEDDLYHLMTVYDRTRRGCINYTDFLQQTMHVVKPAS